MMPQIATARRRFAYRGYVLVYVSVLLVTLCAVVSLAVDWGRVQLVRSELSIAADAAARAGAMALSISAQSAQAAAVAVAGYNKADGTAVVLNAAIDIEIGKWKAAENKFVPGNGNADAVRVTCRRTAARGNAVKLTFGAVLGKGQHDASAVAIAQLTTDPIPSSVTNKSNPWLAGMPPGTKANGFDEAPSASPTLVQSGGLVGGSAMTFDVSGETTNQTGIQSAYAPDGNLSWIIHNYPGNENGIADLSAPISSFIGVFLNDSAPNQAPAPASLDFTTAASRDFTSLSPQLKQPFFIGDGKRANGDIQQFVIPAGATRLFVGSMDGQQWSDNGGGFSVTLRNQTPIYRVITVK